MGRCTMHETPRFISPSVFYFTNKAMVGVLRWYPLLVAAFIVAKWLGIRPITVATAEHMLGMFDRTWPLVVDQFLLIKKADEFEAANYVLFMSVTVILMLFVVLYTICFFIRPLSIRRNFTKYDFGMDGLSLVMAYHFLRIEGIANTQRPLMDFFPDAFGLYYVRQGLANFAILTCLIFVTATVFTAPFRLVRTLWDLLRAK
jgi:hypothetical protein